MTPIEKAAEVADRLLNDPVLKDAIAEIEQDTIEALIRLPFWSSRRQRMLLDRIKVIRGIQDQLRSTILVQQTMSRKRPIVA